MTFLVPAESVNTPWQRIKFSDLDDRQDYSINNSVKKNSNILIETEKILNFHFSHYKSSRIQNISGHRNQSENKNEKNTQNQKHNQCKGLCHKHINIMCFLACCQGS